MVIKTQGTQKESQIVSIERKNPPVLHYDLDYDTTKPEETLRDFVSAVKGMITRYNEDKERIIELEAEMNDLEHYIEAQPFKPVGQGYMIYRRLAEIRKERRACKSEIDLLWPIYEHFHATEVLNKLSMVQGECAKAKGAIDVRCYVCRTDIVEELNKDPWSKKSKSAPEPEEECTVTVIHDDSPVEEAIAEAN